MSDYLQKPPDFFHAPPKRPDAMEMPPIHDPANPSISEETYFIPPSELHNPVMNVDTDPPIEFLNTDEEAKHQGGAVMNYSQVGMEALQNAFGHETEEHHEPVEDGTPLDLYELKHALELGLKSWKGGAPLGPAPIFMPEEFFHMNVMGGTDEDSSA